MFENIENIKSDALNITAVQGYKVSGRDTSTPPVDVSLARILVFTQQNRFWKKPPHNLPCWDASCGWRLPLNVYLSPREEGPSPPCFVAISMEVWSKRSANLVLTECALSWLQLPSSANLELCWISWFADQCMHMWMSISKIVNYELSLVKIKFHQHF